MSEQPLFYVEGRRVFKRPVLIASDDARKTWSVGFQVCALAEFAGDEAAEAIAVALNDLFGTPAAWRRTYAQQVQDLHHEVHRWREIARNRRVIDVSGLTDEQVGDLKAHVRGLTEEKDSYPRPVHGWTCFHCGETFTTAGVARAHFGFEPSQDPGCRIKLGAERGLLAALREAESNAAEAWAAIASETTDAAKAYYAQAARHRQQLTTAEEVGYERGLADARAEGAGERDDRVTAAEAALRLGQVMRDAQRAYFRTRSQADLIASKTAERAFDVAIQSLNLTPSPGQTGRASAAPGPDLLPSGPGREESPHG